MSNDIPFLISFNPSPYPHYPPPLPTFIHPPSQLWKLCKILWKTFSLAYKYPINQRKIPVNSPKSYLDIPFVFYFLFLNLLYPLYIGNPWFPHPPFPKRLSVFSPRPLTSFGSPSNRFSFIEPDGSQMKKPTSSCSHFKKGF